MLFAASTPAPLLPPLLTLLLSLLVRQVLWLQAATEWCLLAPAVAAAVRARDAGCSLLMDWGFDSRVAVAARNVIGFGWAR